MKDQKQYKSKQKKAYTIRELKTAQPKDFQSAFNCREKRVFCRESVCFVCVLSLRLSHV